jgi:two-component system sensor histidine kinase YesM
MKEIEKGHFNIINYAGVDEMQQLVDGYNSMITKTSALIEQVKLEEEEKRNAELYALQAQINPHFLYNTLNSIRYLAKEQGSGEIEQIAISLISLSRASLDSDKFITIKQEIDLVMGYIAIMKIRYEDMFHYTCEIEPDLELCMIPRFSIQPLVENALFHGIVPNEKGNIMVRVLEKDGGILIEVEDSGIGIEQRHLQIIKKNLSGVHEDAIESKDRRSMKNIGLVNINDRIKMYFSPAYGLCIESCPESGTRVSVSIPKQYGSKTADRGGWNEENSYCG